MVRILVLPAEEPAPLAEVAAARPDPPVAPTPRVPLGPSPAAPGQAPAAASPETAAGGGGGEEPSPGDGPTVAERLGPGEVDARLWILDPEVAALSDEQLTELALLWEIFESADSAAAAEAAARALKEWTFTDSNGKKWGVSDGKLHLGDLTLPLPFAFGAPAGSDAARRAWEDAEIARAAGSAAARANMKERIEAIRRRRDLERLNQSRPDSVPAGP